MAALSEKGLCRYTPGATDYSLAVSGFSQVSIKAKAEKHLRRTREKTTVTQGNVGGI